MGKKRMKRPSKKAKKNIKGNRPEETDSPLTFDLSNDRWLKGVSLPKKDYTNYLKNENMFAAYITELFHKVIPLIQKYGDDMIKQAGTQGWQHCHPVEDEELDLAIHVIYEIYGDKHVFSKGKVSGPKLWQFGVTQNLRLIAIHDYTINCLIPLFIDYHHLIYPNEWYNDDNYEKYDFCPIDNLQGQT